MNYRNICYKLYTKRYDTTLENVTAYDHYRSGKHNKNERKIIAISAINY